MIKYLLPLVALNALMYAKILSQVAPSPETSKSTFPPSIKDPSIENIALLPSLPALPSGRATVLGGSIYRLDGIRDEFTLKTFGGGHTKILFDGRTRIYRNDMTAGRRLDLMNGQRVHVDTVLDGTKVFAENIFILTHTPGGESYGQITGYTPATRELILRESLSPTTMKLLLVPSTTIQHKGRAISPMALQPGSLVSVIFQAERNGQAVVQEISVLTEPGDTVEFTGRVVHLDLRAGLVVLEDLRDQKSHEVYFDRAVVPIDNSLLEGANVTVESRFDGTRYIARTLTVNAASRK